MADKLAIVLGRELVKQLVPHRVVVVLATQVDERNAVVLAIDRRIGNCRIAHGVARVKALEAIDKLGAGDLPPCVRDGIAILVHGINLCPPGGHIALQRRSVMLREGALPVRTGEIGDVALGVVEEVRYLGAALCIGSIGGGIDIRVARNVGAHAGGVARHVCTLGGKHVVHRIMGIVSSGNVVGASIQDVGLGSVGVIGLEHVLVKRDGNRLGLARLKQFCLSIVHQLDRALLDPIRAVVVGVGTLCVDLNNVFARDITRVGNVYRHGARGAIPAGLIVAPVKGGVAQAVAKRVYNLAVVVKVASVALAKDSILVSGLVIAIANIDALGIRDVRIAGKVSIAIDVLIVAVVLGSWGVERVSLKRVDGLARRADLAGKDVRQRIGTIPACRGNKQDTLNVRELLEPAQVQRRGGVENHYAIIKVVIDVLKDLQLGRVGLEIGLCLILRACSVVVHGTRHVASLARNAAHHKHGHGVLRRIEHPIGRLKLAERALVDAEVLSCAKVD